MAGIALVVLATVLIGVRAYGIRPKSTKSVSVHVTAGTAAENTRADAATIAAAAQTACQRPGGFFASLLGERGPSSIVVITASDAGPQRRITVDCGTGHIIKTS